MRKTPEEKLAEIEEASQRLKAQKQAIKAQLRSKTRKEDTRRKVIVGSVVLAHAEHDPEFEELLWTILKNRTIRETDRKFLGLEPLSQTQH